MLTRDLISKHLEEQPLASWWEIEVFPEIDSTNSEMQRRIRRGEAREGCVIFAERQTRGRGRRGAAWHGGELGRNLLFSCLFQPRFPMNQWGRLPHLMALAVAIALEQSAGVFPWIKWPNDLMLDGKKLGGILVETQFSPQNEAFAVAGIGLNVNEERFPPELEGIAVSLRQAAGSPLDRNFLAAAILGQLQRHYEGCLTHFSHYLNEIRHRSYLLGKQVKLTLREESIRGRVDDFGPEGELILRLEDGTLESITSADEVRPLH